jgi:hypothetical protein
MLWQASNGQSNLLVWTVQYKGQTKSDAFPNLDSMMVLCLQHLRCCKVLTGLCVRAGYFGYQLCTGWQLQALPGQARGGHCGCAAPVLLCEGLRRKHVCFVDHHAAQLPSCSCTPGMTTPLIRPPPY